MIVEQTFDVTLEIAQSPAQQVDILARVADLDPVHLAVMAADGAGRGGRETLRQVHADGMATVVAEGRDGMRGHAVKGGRRRVVMAPQDTVRVLSTGRGRANLKTED